MLLFLVGTLTFLKAKNIIESLMAKEQGRRRPPHAKGSKAHALAAKMHPPQKPLEVELEQLKVKSGAQLQVLEGTVEKLQQVGWI